MCKTVAGPRLAAAWHRTRDWRIASRALMLIAVANMFLIVAAGLDGLLRTASPAALGFGLIGIGRLQVRFPA